MITGQRGHPRRQHNRRTDAKVVAISRDVVEALRAKFEAVLPASETSATARRCRGTSPPPPRCHCLRMSPTAERLIGEQRCESCNTFARRVGIGGACPNCDGPVAISDLLDQALVTITKK